MCRYANSKGLLKGHSSETRNDGAKDITNIQVDGGGNDAGSARSTKPRIAQTLACPTTCQHDELNVSQQPGDPPAPAFTASPFLLGTS